MKILSHLSSVSSTARVRAESGSRPGPTDAFWYTPEALLAFGDSVVGSDLALTLSHVYCAVDTISSDFGSAACQTFEDLGNEGRRRVQYGEAGIGVLARKLRWQPNNWQTAKAFWSTLAWQYLLRPAAYAECLYRVDVPTVIDQIIPRHPDRVKQEPLKNGRVRYRLTEPDGSYRWVNQENMLVVRNTSLDGLNAISRMQYGSKSLATGLALQEFTRHFFQKGITGALVATYKGAHMEEEEENALHRSITRFVAGAENAGGLLLIPEDIETKALGVDPEKAQLLGLKNISGRDVARMFKMPPSWLGIEGAQSYGSQVQDAQNYVNRGQVPLVIEFEQAAQRDLIVASRFFIKFNLDYLTRTNTKERFESYEIAIRSRVMRPSEARVKEDMSPDPALDKLSEGDNRPGTPKGTAGQGGSVSGPSARARSIALAAAERVVRRETAAIAAAAKKHASDDSGFAAWARSFYGTHVGFVESVMAMSRTEAADYCAGQSARLATEGLAGVGDWEVLAPAYLADLALCWDGAAA